MTGPPNSMKDWFPPALSLQLASQMVGELGKSGLAPKPDFHKPAWHFREVPIGDIINSRPGTAQGHTVHNPGDPSTLQM